MDIFTAMLKVSIQFSVIKKESLHEGSPRIKMKDLQSNGLIEQLTTAKNVVWVAQLLRTSNSSCTDIK